VSTAAVFTTNKFCAPPVQASRERMKSSGGKIVGVIVNSGNANAGTGEEGRRVAEAMCDAAAEAIGCSTEQILVCSTGLIGKTMPLDIILAGTPKLAKKLSRNGGADAAQGIMTTDKITKTALVEEDGFTVGGIAKGCGMISPNMATMLAFITTDAEVEPEQLQKLLTEAVDDSFNALEVDGATSTNDTVVMMASGRRGPADPAKLEQAIRKVCSALALQIARDAEGGSKVVTVRVTGAANDAEAKVAARRISRNPLVKCSWRGGDPYWGRILSEAGASGIAFEPEKSALAYGGVTVSRGGIEITHDKEKVARHMEADEIELELSLGLGSGTGHILSVDLGPGYIRENSRTS
jgi:glutamate N-acetyltransferase/amino-acid N-acetyltransferase